jgi:hypothetical protein
MASWPVLRPAQSGSLTLMGTSGSSWSMAGAMASLTERFGDDLTLWRDRGTACWRYDGQSVLITASPDGTIEATFVDRPSFDAVSGSPAVAIYQRTTAGGYTLTAEGGSRMADDMSAFFTGVREARFTFVSVEGLHSAA